MKSAETETTAPAGAAALIHDRGRGPEIKGTRITVYDVLDYALACWPPERIATLFNLRTEEIQAAVEYISEHKIEVLTDYLKILERCRRGHPPDLQAKIDENHQKFEALVQQVRQIQARAKEEIHEAIQRHRSGRAEENAHAAAHGGS